MVASKRVGTLLSSVLILTLAACGGGGSSGSSSVADQSIAFAASGPVKKVAGGPSFINAAAGGGGNSPLTYTSSDSTVAAVNANTGEVTLVGAGAATITATKAADGNYKSAQASYALEVAPNELTASSWVGTSNTLTSFTTAATGMQFIRSGDANCSLANYALCTRGQLDTLTGATVTDTAADLTHPAWYWLKHRANESLPTAVAAPVFGARFGHQTVVFNNKLWVIGGWDGTYLNDVWSSSDGQSWTQATAAAAFSGREGFKAIAYNGKLWVVGGTDGTVRKNDVWSSTDGVTWTQVMSNAAFTARMGHDMAVFANKLWLFGGNTGNNASDYVNDAWSSSDVVVWTLEKAAAAFSARGFDRVTAFNNWLWMVGGWDGTTLKNDVWRSADCVTWTLYIASAAFAARADHQLIVFNNKLWLLGGNGGGRRNDVWYSSNGSDWTLASGGGAAFSFPVRGGHQAAVFKEKMWVIGGDSGSVLGDVWTSPST